MFEALVARGFQVLALHHAEAILRYDMPEAIDELETVLQTVEIPIEELIRGGGGEGKLTQRLRRGLSDLGWTKHNFEIRKTVDGKEKESISHEIDHVKDFGTGVFALEIEWNNKDPFFDRDLENFKRLHADGVISIGGIITRGTSFQNSIREHIASFARNRGLSDVASLSDYYSPTPRQVKAIERSARSAGSFEEGWARFFVADKFGMATTHWGKLEDRVRRGVGNPCPLLLIGIPDSVIVV
ncbi:MAG: restriction endonuclease [Gammaproteobacteria bacterium]|nr:restriction endonuclease [Gammaproteobacteria bacterium]